MNVVMLGATGGIGRAVARRLAARGDRLFLLGRSAEGVARTAADLNARAPGPVVGSAPCNLVDPAGFVPSLAAAADALGRLDCVVVTAATFDVQERLESDASAAADVLATGFTGTVLFCEAARRQLLAAGGGTLCVISSVAGDRARKPVVLYGAAKAGLSYYLDGLDLRYRARGLRTVCIKPGFVETAMTAGLRPPPFAATADAVARRVVRAIDRGRPVVYAPPVWRLIMTIIRLLPRGLRRRLDF